MSHDIDGKPLFDPYRIESAGPAWDPHREYPEPEPDDYPLGAPGRSSSPFALTIADMLPVAREELKEAEHHLATARAIREDGHDAHNVGYWEKEVATPPTRRWPRCRPATNAEPAARSPSRTRATSVRAARRCGDDRADIRTGGGCSPAMRSEVGERAGASRICEALMFIREAGADDLATVPKCCAMLAKHGRTNRDNVGCCDDPRA